MPTHGHALDSASGAMAEAGGLHAAVGGQGGGHSGAVRADGGVEGRHGFMWQWPIVAYAGTTDDKSKASRLKTSFRLRRAAVLPFMGM